MPTLHHPRLWRTSPMTAATSVAPMNNAGIANGNRTTKDGPAVADGTGAGFSSRFMAPNHSSGSRANDGQDRVVVGGSSSAPAPRMVASRWARGQAREALDCGRMPPPQEARMLTLIRALTYAVLFITLVIVLLPAQVMRWAGVTRPAHDTAWQVAGTALVVLGGVLAISCVVTFALEGRGTPAPFDPPRTSRRGIPCTGARSSRSAARRSSMSPPRPPATRSSSSA